jgi:hypothetical protein
MAGTARAGPAEETASAFDSAGFGVSGRLAAFDRLLVYAARLIVPLSALTPVNAGPERARLVEELRAGRRPRPRWQYAAPPNDDLRRVLGSAERDLVRRVESPLDGLYLERIRELALEAALSAAAGTHEVGRLATLRFAPRREGASGAGGAGRAGAASGAGGAGGAGGAENGAELAAAWLRESPPVCTPGALIVSDADDSRSLFARMRAEVGRLGVPFVVRAAPALAALAATGENVILVATGRPLAEEDIARTVLHEVHGHAFPRVRAARATSALFRAGTARGADDQEGRALWLEQRAGFLRSKRRRQLASRHDAVEAMQRGASFADVAVRLVHTHGVSEAEAVIVAERAFRGSDGTHPGLGRERVYLPSLLRVGAYLEAHPEDDRVLASGQISVDAIDALRAYAPSVEERSDSTGRLYKSVC